MVNNGIMKFYAKWALDSVQKFEWKNRCLKVNLNLMLKQLMAQELEKII
jgi:hypothetical protein